MKEALTKIGLGEASDFDTKVWKQAKDEIASMKVVIGAAVVYHITLKQKADFADKELRGKAVDELRETFKKSNIVLSEFLQARLSEFESSV